MFFGDGKDLWTITKVDAGLSFAKLNEELIHSSDSIKVEFMAPEDFVITQLYWVKLGSKIFAFNMKKS